MTRAAKPRRVVYVTTTELRRNLGRVLAKVRRADVAVTRRGEVLAYLVSISRREQLQSDFAVADYLGWPDDERWKLIEGAPIAKIIERAIAVFRGSVKANRWLTTPNEALGGAKPLELAASRLGNEAVHDLLNAIEHGMLV